MMVAALATMGCREQFNKATGEGGNSSPKTSIGEPYEVFVICNDSHWESHIKEAATMVLEDEVPGLVRPEKFFHIIDHKSSDQANDLERKHSNILAVRIDVTNEKASINISEDVYATHQVIVTVHSPSVAEAAQCIIDCGDVIRKAFDDNERTIHHKHLCGSISEEPIKIVKNLTGLDMHIPGGFSVAKPSKNILKWFVRKYANKAQHIFVFTEPCEDINNMTPDDLEKVVDDHIGVITVEDEEDTSMRISKSRPFYFNPEPKVFNGRNWYEARCCWDVDGYPLGGSMVCYYHYDEANKRLITIAFALFSPEQPHRHDMAQLESLMYLVK